MFVDNEPYGIEAVCDCCKVPMEDNEFDFRQKWVNHIHANCFYSMLDEDGRLPGNLPIYFNHEYKGNWEELMEKEVNE